MQCMVCDIYNTYAVVSLSYNVQGLLLLCMYVISDERCTYSIPGGKVFPGCDHSRCMNINCNNTDLVATPVVFHTVP